jgi:ribosomal protein S18 acetylase RimI-like enzyme
MLLKSKNSQWLQLRALRPADFANLSDYLQHLSSASKSRFGPHAFDEAGVSQHYQDPYHVGYVAIELETGKIVAYAAVVWGYLKSDAARLESYGVAVFRDTDATYAPSVADEWQNQGLGSKLFLFVCAEMKSAGRKRLILWGGVQNTNTLALAYYRKLGFRYLGSFEYNGWNDDMILDLL